MAISGVHLRRTRAYVVHRRQVMRLGLGPVRLCAACHISLRFVFSQYTLLVPLSTYRPAQSTSKALCSRFSPPPPSTKSTQQPTSAPFACLCKLDTNLLVRPSLRQLASEHFYRQSGEQPGVQRCSHGQDKRTNAVYISQNSNNNSSNNVRMARPALTD